MEMYDFDHVVDRHGSGAMKYDSLKCTYGSDDLLPMWIADMDFAVAPAIVEALHGRFAHPVYGYALTPDSYWDSIVSWLDSRHGFKVSRDDITFVPGVVKGIAYCVNYFTRPGDSIIIQPPVYHPFKRVIEGNGRVVAPNPLLRTDSGYEMDLEGLEEVARRHKPSMMILCNPHNPVGIQWSRETLARVADIARRYNFLVVSDEIHGDLMLQGRRHIPFLDASPVAAKVGIMLGAPSKTFNIPGLVSSWCIIKDKELRKDFYEWMEVNEFSAPTFSATVGTEAAYRHAEPWLDAVLEYIQRNIDYARDYIAANIPAMKVVMPQASFLVWLDCRGLGLEQHELVDRFVNRAHLALNDGEMFGDEGTGYMRLNVACPRCVLQVALEHLRDAFA